MHGAGAPLRRSASGTDARPPLTAQPRSRHEAVNQQEDAPPPPPCPATSDCDLLIPKNSWKNTFWASQPPALKRRLQDRALNNAPSRQATALPPQGMDGWMDGTIPALPRRSNPGPTAVPVFIPCSHPGWEAASRAMLRAKEGKPSPLGAGLAQEELAAAAMGLWTNPWVLQALQTLPTTSPVLPDTGCMLAAPSSAVLALGARWSCRSPPWQGFPRSTPSLSFSPPR